MIYDLHDPIKAQYATKRLSVLSHSGTLSNKIHNLTRESVVKIIAPNKRDTQ